LTLFIMVLDPLQLIIKTYNNMITDDSGMYSKCLETIIIFVANESIIQRGAADD